MKKLYTLLASALFVATAATGQVSLPYVSGSMTAAPGSDVDDNSWTQLDCSGAEPWYFQVNAQRCFEVDATKGHDAYLLRLNRGAQDDWLVSPAFNIKGETEYKITFYAAKSSTAAVPDEFEVYFTSYNPIRDKDMASYYDHQSVTALPDPVDYAPVYRKHEMTFSTDPGESGTYYFAFHVKSAGKSGLIGVADVTIEELGEEPEEPGQPEVSGVPVPYESTIADASGVFAEGWTTINANNDNQTWTACTETSKYHSLSGLYAQCRYHSTNASDDFLSSPAIHMEAGKEYKVLYGYRTYNTSNKEHMTVYVSPSVADAASITGGVMLADYDDNAEEKWSATPNVWSRQAVSFTPEATGDYHISFHACSEKNKYYVYVSDFAVLENVFAPAGVSTLVATPGADRAMECVLSWTLPTESVFGDPFTAEQTVESVAVYRDGGEAPVATLKGAVSEFTDTEATGLTSGYHTYSVKVTVAGVESPAVEVRSRYVGPVAPVAVPAKFKHTTSDDFDLYTVIYGPDYSPTDDTSVWSYAATSNQIQLSSGTGTVEDSWLITPPVEVAEAGYYRVTLNARVGYAGPTDSHKFEYCVGSDDTVEAMEVRCTDIGLTSGLSPHYFDFYASEPGVYYVGIHACDVKTSRNIFYVASINVDASRRLPAAVTALAAVPAADESLNIELSWENPSVSFAGDAMSTDEYKVLVYIDGERALTLSGEELVPGVQTATIPVASTGVYNVKVQTVALDEEESSVDVHPSVTTSWIGPRTVGLPYTADFTAGGHPSFAIWDIIDGNNDGQTWVFDMESYYSKCVKLQGYSVKDGLYEYNDYLLTPDFDLLPGNYSVTVSATGGTASNPFYFNLGAFKAGEFDTDKAQWTASKQCNVGGYSAVDCTFDFTVTEAGKYQVVVAADELFTTSHYSHLQLKKFAIKAVVALPALATDVAVTPGADFALEATVSWKNPTETSLAGVSLAEGDIVKAVVYRNGVEVGTVEEGLVPGLEASFTDTTVPTGGVYTYKVEIYNANGCSETAATEVKSMWIGPGLEIPVIGLNYGADWEDGPFSGWTIVDANKTQKVLEVSFTYGLGITSNNVTPDCYAYSRPVQFEKGNIYKVVVDSHYNFDVLGEVTPELHYGTSDDVTEFVKVGEWSIPAECTNRNKLHSATFYLYAVDASEIEAQADDSEGDDDLITKSVKVPAGALRLALRANDKGSYYLRNMEIRHEKSITGVDDVKVSDGIIYTGGALSFEGEAAVEVYTLTGMLVSFDAHAVDGFDLASLAKGVYVVRVTTADGKSVTVKIVK